MTAAFVDGNGITLTMSAMKTFIKDTELVWHVIGLLNGLSGKSTAMSAFISKCRSLQFYV